MNRRVFVRSGTLALVTMGLDPTFLRRTAFAARPRGARRGRVLIVLFQRGAADALNMVVPHGDADYYRLRPGIGIPRPARGAADRALDLDGFFGLHPALAPLQPLYERGILAPIHAVGSPSATRSHFDAQDYMETGTPDRRGTADGWLNRYLATHGTCEQCAPASAGGATDAAAVPSPLRAVALAEQTPRILEGPARSVALGSLDDLVIHASGSDAAARLEALYRTGSDDIVHGAGSELFDAMKMLRESDPRRYQPAGGAVYPRSPFGQRLRQIAQLVKAGVGMEVAFADVGGWDTHVNQGGAAGQLAARLSDFALGIAALVTDLDDRMDDVAIVTMSEFGRMARENGTRGTDHGHAGAMFVVGGNVRGGRVHGRWPGLGPDQLHEGRDLALTTDFRAVFGELVSRHLGAEHPELVFPGYAGAEREWLGVVRT